jgi:hypothetical protein
MLVENRSGDLLTLLPPSLRTNSQEYSGDFGSRNGESILQWKVEDGATERVPYQIDLEETLGDVGEEVRLTLPYRIGTAAVEEVEVTLKRR